jgi:hypothetical protein
MPWEFHYGGRHLEALCAGQNFFHFTDFTTLFYVQGGKCEDHCAVTMDAALTGEMNV